MTRVDSRDQPRKIRGSDASGGGNSPPGDQVRRCVLSQGRDMTKYERFGGDGGAERKRKGAREKGSEKKEETGVWQERKWAKRP